MGEQCGPLLLIRKGTPSHKGPPAAAYLVKAGVLDVVRGHLLLAFDLHVDLQADGPRHGRLVCSFFWKEKSTCERHACCQAAQPEQREGAAVGRRVDEEDTVTLAH